MSTLKADTIVASDGSSPVTLTKQSAAKAWWDGGTITTTVLNNSFNISSLTDNGTGSTTASFTNTFSTANYFQNCSANNYISITSSASQTTSSFLCATYDNTFSPNDGAYTGGLVHGDLA